jgi:hypothetical protein
LGLCIDIKIGIDINIANHQLIPSFFDWLSMAENLHQST